MKKALIFLLILFIFPIISAEVSGVELNLAEIGDKINSIVHYAEEYEVGNINYLQLNVYGHKIRSDMNLLLGGGIGEEWGRIPKENIEKVLGVPNGHTNWVWIDNKHVNKRLNESLPQWEKIVFDGRKLRIIFNAFPSAMELENGELFKYYSVDLNVRFKKEYAFDFDGMLEEVANLAADYNATGTRKSGEDAVKKMLEAQRLWSGYVQENSEQCVAILDSLFEPDEKGLKRREMEWRFPIHSGSDFDVITNIHMCDECEWHYVSVDFWFESRTSMILTSPELQYGKLEHQVDEKYFWTLSADELNQELKKTVFEIKDEAEKFDKARSEDFAKKFYFDRFKVQQINRILDGKYNEVQDFDRSIAKRIESGELTGPGGCKNLGDCKGYCGNRNNTEECRKFTYDLRVDSLGKMFTGFEIEKTPFDRIEWERRLFENTVTRQDSWCRHVNDIQCKEDEGCADGKCVSALGGNETCDNRVDDDGDHVADCQDPDCWKERQCGKLCEKVCNKEGGCWQTSNELCSGVCKECWDCGGDEKCKSICEPECWPCHNQEAVKNVCDDCRTCEDEAYGGCYVKCKPCGECNTNRMEKINAIFARAAAGEIKTPGGCMSEEECNKYCAGHGDECGQIMPMIGLWSEEFDCNQECKECSICNNDLGNLKCNNNQHFDRDNGFCVCDAGWNDCDGDWENGCESSKQCRSEPCLEECKECDACGGGEECKDKCLGCNKCRNPNMPTYVCDGVEQSEPCETEYVCNGVKQKKPCETIFICNGRESAKPCDESKISCGKNQLLVGSDCVCREGFKDCDSDGNCESTKSCGLETCDDGKDNNNDGSVDCEDQKCNRQACGTDGGRDMLCINKLCMLPEEEIPPKEPEPICGNHICEKGENETSCQKDCVVCEAYEPPECSKGKIVWKGRDNLGCPLPPICIVTEKECGSDADCPQPKCGVSKCIEGGCKVTELTTECAEGCQEGKIRKRECRDGSNIVTALCAANEWVETGYDCLDAAEILPVILPEKPQNETETPKEAPLTKIKEEVAPEVEEKAPEARGECVLASDCGGSQDVCSNGNCKTLPIPVEKSEKKFQQEAPSGAPEPLSEKTSKETESSKESQPEKTEQIQEPPAKENSPTGSMIANLADYFMKGGITGFFAAAEQPCKNECKPCEECNQKFDSLMKKIQSGEIVGPNNCKNRGECEEYCRENGQVKEECKIFFINNGIKTFDCWQEFCRECDKCKFKAGELKCNANQRFSMEEGFCKCNEGWNDCDGDWENGCESSQQCGGCQSKADCAQDRCAPWGNVIQQFDCFRGESWVEERGVVRILGDCRFYPTRRMEGGVYFDMWGEPFESLWPMREAAERDMGWEWCEWDLENNIKERTEIQSSFTNSSLKWFFEEYVPSSPTEWEKQIGGIYDSYWRIVNNDEQAARNLLCLGRNNLPEEYKPIDISYDTDFGSVRIWEVETTTDFFGKRTRILSPYMQIWVFPPKDFVKKEFQKAMEAGTMPGQEEKKPEFSPSEIEEAKKDKGLMDTVNSISDKYGGEAKFLLRIVDGDEQVFNALITINPDIILKLEPVKEYAGDYDAKIIFDYDFFYSLIGTGEKETRGTQTEYPPWEKGGFKIGDAVKGVVDGVKMWLMINSGVAGGSVRADPPASLSDGLTVMRLMFERSPQ